MTVSVDGSTPVAGVMEYHGASSRENEKSNFRLSFGDNPTTGDTLAPKVHWFGVYGQVGGETQKKLVLKADFYDSTFIREKLTADLMNDIGAPAARGGFATLYVNGQKIGLYTMLERIDDSFVDAWGWKKNGALYKANDHAANWQTMPVIGTGAWEQANSDLEGQPATDLQQLYVALNSPLNTKADWERVVQPLFNIDDYIVYSVVNVLAYNFDGFDKNYFLYREPTGGPFHMIGWDLDNTWGIDYFGCATTVNDQALANPGEGRDYLSPKLFAIPEYNQKFKRLMAELVMPGGCFSEQKIQARVDALANTLRPVATTSTWPGHDDFETALAQLKRDVTARSNAVTSALRAQGFNGAGPKMRKLTFTSPIAGDSIDRATPVRFTWESFAVGFVQLILRPVNGGPDIILDMSTPPDGSKTMTLPDTVPVGTYTLVAKDYGSCGDQWSSQPFKVCVGCANVINTAEKMSAIKSKTPAPAPAAARSFTSTSAWNPNAWAPSAPPAPLPPPPAAAWNQWAAPAPAPAWNQWAPAAPANPTSWPSASASSWDNSWNSAPVSSFSASYSAATPSWDQGQSNNWWNG